MKKFVLIFVLVLLLLIIPVLADDAVSATGYVTLELKEPPKIVESSGLAKSGLTGFSIKDLANKEAPADKNFMLTASLLSLLLILIIFNIYQSMKYLQEQKSIT